ncbi:MAG: hypothetical protein R3327_02580 [Nitrosopumilaceae archaeon]|nr:hypothetical protein [Nitrosopumilaceae archaeon]
MIEKKDAQKVVEVVANNLYGVSKDAKNFEKLPDDFWGYYARGHDKNGKFGVIITYSEKENDVDDLIAKYEEWLKQNKPSKD